MNAHHRLTLRARFLAVAAIVGLAATSAHHAQAQTAEKWDPAIAKFEAQDRVAPPPKHGVVFIGASSIVRWHLEEYFPELGAVYYAGDNDVEANIPASEIAHQFALFEQKVHEALPDTKVIFISIKPSIRRWKWIDTIRTSNAIVKAYCL